MLQKYNEGRGQKYNEGRGQKYNEGRGRGTGHNGKKHDNRHDDAAQPSPN
jgi:hypothetical protein